VTALAAVLAGGRGRRMGGAAKPCAELGGRPLIAWPAAAAGAPVRATLATLAPALLPAGDPQIVASINTPNDLAAAATLLGAGHEGAAPTEVPR
jgi:GTP:adenosylcobinamide-phosphate guanylyltransferase